MRWLEACWQELRGRTRVTIDHPDLPDALKDIASGGRPSGRRPTPPATAPPVVCYRNAAWQSRLGRATCPGSLRRAVNVGQSVEFFRVA